MHKVISTSQVIEIEIDEIGPPMRWSFVHDKELKTWIWLAIERSTRQIVGFATGDRGTYCGQMLWESMPTIYQQNAIFYTDAWAVYDELIPAGRRRQQAGGTAHIE